MDRLRKRAACERALQWVSLELDGELSEFERALLERHLECCVSCAALRLELGGLTRLIRAAPPVSGRPRPAVPAPAARRRSLPRRAVAGVLVAAVLAAGAGVGLLGARSTPVGSSALAFASLGERLRFVHAEHVRIDPLEDAGVQPGPAAPSFAARALM
jgi:predicted anti-sigma-YlaC factor YlaD